MIPKLRLKPGNSVDNNWFLSDEGPMLETLDYILSVLAVHRPFYTSISNTSWDCFGERAFCLHFLKQVRKSIVNLGFLRFLAQHWNGEFQRAPTNSNYFVIVIKTTLKKHSMKVYGVEILGIFQLQPAISSISRLERGKFGSKLK